MLHHNLALLIETARLLVPLLNELAFVGGSTTALLITDEAAADVRSSYNVDVIAAITSYADYVGFSERIRQLGFTEENREGAPLCRWRHKQLILDVMPLDEKVLGFSNRWYKAAMDSAEEREIASGLPDRCGDCGLFLRHQA
jgi:hypothetical protein